MGLPRRAHSNLTVADKLEHRVARTGAGLLLSRRVRFEGRRVRFKGNCPIIRTCLSVSLVGGHNPAPLANGLTAPITHRLTRHPWRWDDDVRRPRGWVLRYGRARPTAGACIRSWTPGGAEFPLGPGHVPTSIARHSSDRRRVRAGRGGATPITHLPAVANNRRQLFVSPHAARETLLTIAGFHWESRAITDLASGLS